MACLFDLVCCRGGTDKRAVNTITPGSPSLVGHDRTSKRSHAPSSHTGQGVHQRRSGEPGASGGAFALVILFLAWKALSLWRKGRDVSEADADDGHGASPLGAHRRPKREGGPGVRGQQPGIWQTAGLYCGWLDSDLAILHLK